MAYRRVESSLTLVRQIPSPLLSPSLSSRPLLLPFPSPFLSLEVGPLNTARGLGER